MMPGQRKTSITSEELYQLVARAGVELLDVRTPGEYAAAHVPGARLIPLDQLDVAGFLKERGPGDRPVCVLCQTGGRARKAIEKFQGAGFEHCLLLEGGTEAWISAGLPVNRGGGRTLPLIRQVHIIVGIIAATSSVLALAADSRWAILPLILGSGLLFAGLTGICGMAWLLAKMPWNRAACAGSGSCANPTVKTP